MQQSSHDWSDLLTKYFEKRISPGELSELRRQMATSEAKKQQFLKLTDPDLFAEELRNLYKIDAAAAWQKFTDQIPALKRSKIIPVYRKLWFISSTAAAFLIVLSIVLYFSLRKNAIDYPYVVINKKIINLESASDGPVANTCYALVSKHGRRLKIDKPLNVDMPLCSIFQVVTPPGKPFEVELSDGSVIKVSANSTFNFPSVFNSNERTVALRGEAYFKVARDERALFTVRMTDRVKIQVFGTEFNVEAYGDTVMKTTLVNGSIDVVVGGDTTVTMKPGQQVRLSKTSLSVLDSVDVEQVSAWTNDVFDFEHLSVEDMMKQVGHWYGYEIKMPANMPPSETSGGRIARSESLSTILKTIEDQNQISIEKSGKKLIVKRKNKQ